MNKKDMITSKDMKLRHAVSSDNYCCVSRQLLLRKPTTTALSAYKAVVVKTSPLRHLLLLLLLLLTGATAAWGQTHPYEGVWYMRIKKTNTHYMVPAANPQQASNEDAYFSNNYSSQVGDPEKPFITTYATDGDLNSIWIFEPVSDESNYYYIVHALTGKYIKYQTYLSGGDARRKFVHLETLATPGETEKFEIREHGTGVKIKPKGQDLYLNVAGDCQDSYNGGTKSPYYSGIIGGYASIDDNSVFLLTDASKASTLTPVIGDVNTNNNTFTITSPAAAFTSFRFTTDGETTPTASVGTLTDGTSVAIMDEWSVQAVGVRGSFVTPVAGPKALVPVVTTPIIRFDNTTNKASITCNTSGVTIYYNTGDGSQADPNSSSTAYGSPFDVTTPTTVKAIAFKDDHWSFVATRTISQVETPTIQNNGNNAVSITSATEDATIYYTTDGSTPTTSSTIYTEPLTENVSNVTIKAIAVKTNMITSEVGSGTVKLQCATPVITRDGMTFTITCSLPNDVTIYYSLDGSTPTTLYGGPVTFTSEQLPMTVTAVAKHDDYTDSEQASFQLLNGHGTPEEPYLIYGATDFANFISNVNDGTTASACYKLETDVSAISSAITTTFTGTFDGDYHTISGLTHPLFQTVDGGMVKNLILDNVSISGSGNVGAICNEADGSTRIYNCGILSGSVSGSNYVGGLVGHIAADSKVRVVNCYNYATISGGSTKAGIVGQNDGTVGDVRIALCMMYGDMPGGTSPVYAGNHTSNAGNFTEYNFWRSRADISYTVYNDQLAIDKDDYLTRFPFYRHILNTHRELAAYFLFGTTGQGVGDITPAQISEIGHWALKKDVAPYPIIEPWETDTKKILDAPATNTVSDDKLGTSLSVSVIIGTNSYSASLPITGMDEANFDYTYGKVVLPFANEFETNADYSKVCTGWKITGITGGTEGTFANYNVADRDCTVKDLYSTTGFIFAQGGNYIVPYGVTSIEITANFATAYYLSDEAYEIAYSGDNTGSNTGYIGRTALGGSMPDLYQGQTVYHTLTAALTAMSRSGSTHEQAVVLVGNYHQDSENINNNNLTSKGLTIMSIDADNNQEPDYAWYSNNTQDRPAIPPTRFDFVALIPMGMSSRVNNSTYYPVIPLWKPRGWFEMTETSLSYTDQFELSSGNFNTSAGDTRNYRCIINGGYFTQMVRSRGGSCNKVTYFQIGGNAYIKEFYPGSHSADNYATPLVPINVTGGEIEQCFMTGYGKKIANGKIVNGTATGSNIYFWCAGGKIGKFLGAYMETPTSTNGVNMTAKVDHAKIGRFFGGGTSPSAPITGNIDVTINNSHVDFYCGGPEFGDMSSGKTVTTHATNTTFGEYYGAGFGGTAITYTNDEDNTSQGLGNTSKPEVTYPSSFFTNHFVSNRLKYKEDYGIGNCYKFEFIMISRGHNSVARFYTGYAKFSLAQTGSVTNVLNNCEFENDFYGAGCQGTVNGTVTSTLTGCTVAGDVFGGGYKAVSNEVEVYPTTLPTMSVYNRERGIFSDFGTVEPEIFTWEQGTEENNNKWAGDTSTTLYTGTDVKMSDMGNVTDAISLTIDGGSVTGSVYGGGNESKSLNNATIDLKGNLTVGGNVFGGGNKGIVEGKATVNIEE